MLRIVLSTVLLLVTFSPAAHSLTGRGTMAEAIGEPFTGDYGQMKKGQIVRVLISFSLTDYYLDKGKEKGLVAEIMREFKTYINRGIKKETKKIEVVLIPVPRDQLIPGLVAGHGDIAVANLTITPERQERVDFSDPVLPVYQ